MKPLRHFPITTNTETATGVTTYTALCGFTSTDGKQFIDPRNYKPENVAACCKEKQKGQQHD